MSRTLATQYAHLIASLADSIKSQWAWPSPEAGFAIFVLQDLGPETPLPPIDVWPSEDRLIHAPSIAAAGYAIACNLGNDQESAWRTGIERLRGREAFPSDRQSFAYRPIELLGIVAGIAKLDGAADLNRWIAEVLRRSRGEHAEDRWARMLQYAAEQLVKIKGGHLPAIDECEGVEELSVLWWLNRRFEIPVDGKELAQAILERSALEPLAEDDLPQAAIVFGAVREIVRETISSDVEANWQIGRETKDSAELITRLCRRFHIFAEQILQRREGRETIRMNDEYDVQDALHALLRLHFEDVRPEEVAPSVGGKASRIDFLLKRERIVVEAKMTRRGLDQKKVGDELIVDVRRYQSHPGAGTLICLVYDPGGYCPSPTALEQDLSGTQGGLRTIVIVCPQGL